MAVVCCYFNNAGYESRLRNYVAFSDGLQATGLHLLTIELAFGDEPYQLETGYGETLHLRSSDVMWQKERLLNIGISRLLDRGFKKIIWLDADIILDEPEIWAWQVAAVLEKSLLCQVFSDVVIDTSKGAPSYLMTSSVKHWMESGQVFEQPSRWPSRRYPLGLPRGNPGFGWAARADLLQEHPLYDRAIVGGGDSLVFAASCGAHRSTSRAASQLFTAPLPRCPACRRQCDSPELRSDYLDWADGWHDAVKGQLTYVDHPIRHLYHGDLADRGYQQRRGYLLRHSFAPSRDLELNNDDCWVWKSSNSDLRRDVLHYLSTRKEDGPVLLKGI